jgi:hypothetical protein
MELYVLVQASRPSELVPELKLKLWDRREKSAL